MSAILSPACSIILFTSHVSYLFELTGSKFFQLEKHRALAQNSSP
jgi:hypothetical protein